ncbi:hypothetical protein PAAG_11267 [Paracoccidioides lutzii Pb01]|uniref:Uncharacterized protein n=1 Tax=Paracoccidioides lutzii (strain ATCC MYA-826 / Pb01) TaxID=502779 RepID=A0A0A2VLY8_PARBA|nr:hypothetical protein PAAG_11267 [Paracoccidioides lutzii Pb01]KGQ01879.1 hypothetical protein PAAG_11267 [Paracoccidioides lutzii Pb01]
MESKLEGKRVAISGVSSGIGVETVRAIAATGATLYLTAREEKIKTSLRKVVKPDRIHLVQMDWASLESVRNVAKEILEKTDKS